MNTVDSVELSGWWAYLNHVEPLSGEERTHLLLANLLCVVVNYLRKKNTKEAEPRDFMPWLNRLKGPRKPQTPEEQQGAMRMVQKMLGPKGE